MQHNALKYLYYIEYSIDLIFDFLESTPEYFSYQKDQKTKSAVERHLAIIGEAANKYKQTKST